MGVFGIPSENELLSMFGYVSDEDREKWNRKNAASGRGSDGANQGATAKGLASKAAAPVIAMAEKSINAQMQGEQTAEREAQRKGRIESFTERTRYYENEVPPKADDHEMGY